MYTVDASVWVNAFDQREPGHLISHQFLEVLRGRALPIIVPNLVVVEVAGAISRTRHAPAQAQAFAEALNRLPHVTVQMLDEGCALHTRLVNLMTVCTPAVALAALIPPP